MALLDVIELLLLVDVDEHAAFDDLAETRALDLARLEDDVAIREDDGRAEAGGVLDRVDRARIEPVCERVVHQEARYGQQRVITRMADARVLERAQVVGVAELRAELLEDLEVLLRAFRADLLHEVAPQVERHPIVVEQGVVDVEEDDDRAPGRTVRAHGRASFGPSSLAAAASTS